MGTTAGHRASPLGADRDEYAYFNHSLRNLSAALTYRMGPAREGPLPRFRAPFSQWELGGGLGLSFGLRGMAASASRVPTASLDSVAESGARRGEQAARAQRTLIYSIGGFSGALPAGFWGGCVEQNDCRAFVLAGVALAGATALIAATTGLEPSGPFLAEISRQDPRYRDSARSAYRAEIRRRRPDAILRAGTTSAVLGVLLALLAMPST